MCVCVCVLTYCVMHKVVYQLCIAAMELCHPASVYMCVCVCVASDGLGMTSDTGWGGGQRIVVEKHNFLYKKGKGKLC